MTLKFFFILILNKRIIRPRSLSERINEKSALKLKMINKMFNNEALDNHHTYKIEHFFN